MANVIITINNRPYQMACDDGQEAHLQALAREIDRRAQQLAQATKEQTDIRLLLMVSLLMADELNEAKAKSSPEHFAALDRALAGGIETLIRRVDGIAERLEKA